MIRLKFPMRYLSFLLVLFVSLSALAQRQDEWRSSDGLAHATHVGGVWILHVYGSDHDMAKQHGELYKQVHDGESMPMGLDFHIYAIPNMLQAVAKSEGLANNLFRGLRYLGRNLITQMPEFMRDTIDGMVEGLNGKYTEQELFDAYLSVDLGKLISAGLFGRNGALAYNRCAEGCSGLIQPRQDGSLWLAHNLDLDGGLYLMRHPTFVYYHPDDGRPAYLSVTSLGVHTAGAFAVNEYGVALSLNQMMVDQVFPRRNAWPSLAISEDIIRRARTYEEAEQILRGHFEDGRVANSWVMSLAGPEEGTPNRFKASVFDVTPRILHQHEGDDVRGFANHPTSEELMQSFIRVTPSALWGSQGRAQHLVDAQENGDIRKVDQVFKTMLKSSVSTTNTMRVIDWRRKRVHLFNFPRLLSGQGVTQVEVPFPGQSGHPKEVKIKSIPKDDAQALSAIVQARHYRDMEKPRNTTYVLELFNRALSQYDDARIPATWLFIKSVLILEHGFETTDNFDTLRPYAIEATYDLMRAIRRGPVDNPPGLWNVDKGAMNEVQKAAAMNWIYVLQNAMDFEMYDMSKETLFRQFEEIKPFVDKNILKGMKRFAKKGPRKGFGYLKRQAKNTFYLKIHDYAIYPGQTILGLSPIIQLFRIFRQTCTE